MCLCVPINLPRYMQKERRSLVLCVGVFRVLRARLTNNDLYTHSMYKTCSSCPCLLNKDTASFKSHWGFFPVKGFLDNSLVM